MPRRFYPPELKAPIESAMRIIFRADASRTIGSGHVVRCLTLARGLRDRGATATFICRDHKGHLCDLVQRSGFDLARLPCSGDTQIDSSIAHSAWLGSSWQEDAKQTRRAIEALEAKPDWLVVDHYALDRRWESALRTSAGKILAIDDLADRLHDCDLLLDQNIVAQMQTRYRGKVPAGSDLLLGPEYALLQPNYAELHGERRRRDGKIRRIFIFFGGVDDHELTRRALSAFVALGRPDIEVDVVVPSDRSQADAIRKKMGAHRNIHLHADLPTLAPFMAAADLAVGASGATSLERLCLGLPSLVITLAENQRPVAEELHRQGLIFWLGDADHVSDATIRQALSDAIYCVQSRFKAAGEADFVDGCGVSRVCDRFFQSLSPSTGLAPTQTGR